MANLPVISFNAGHMTPKIDTRSDTEKYSSGCRIIENMLPLIYGPAERRPGTEYIATAKNSPQGIRLFPFIYSATIAYMCEFGDLYARFYFDGSRVLSGTDIVEVVTPFLVADLPQVQYDQSADVMWLVHSSYPQQKLSRITASSFSMDRIVFTKGPFLERNDIAVEDDVTMATNVTDADAAGTMTASAATFEDGHIGSIWKLTHKREDSVVKGSASGTGVIDAAIDVKGAWTFTTHGNWDATIEIQRNEDGTNWETFRSYTSVMTNGVGSRNVQKTDIEETDGVQYRMYVTEYTDGTVEADFTVNDPTLEGIIRIDTVASSIVANITVLSKVASTDATKRWAEGAWSGVRGYPTSFTLFEERAVYAGTSNNPQRVWLSSTGEFENFETGTTDSDAFELDVPTANTIRWVASLDALMVGTSGDEWRIRATTLDAALTPDDWEIKQQTARGCRNIQAIKVNEAILFVDFVGRKIREMTFSEDRQKFVSPDLTALAEDITETGITSFAHQRNPDSIVWCTLADGTLLSMTYEREQNVVAWAKHLTGLTQIDSSEAEAEAVVPTNYGGYYVTESAIYRFDENFITQAYAESPGAAVYTILDIDDVNGRVLVGNYNGDPEPWYIYNRSLSERESISVEKVAGVSDWSDFYRLQTVFSSDGDYVYGICRTTAAPTRFYIMKWDSNDGSLIWEDNHSVQLAWSIDVDSNGNVFYTTGDSSPQTFAWRDEDNDEEHLYSPTKINLSSYRCLVDEDSGYVYFCGRMVFSQPYEHVWKFELPTWSGTTWDYKATQVAVAHLGLTITQEAFDIAIVDGSLFACTDTGVIHKFDADLNVLISKDLAGIKHLFTGPDNDLCALYVSGGEAYINRYDTNLALIETIKTEYSNGQPPYIWSVNQGAKFSYDVAGTVSAGVTLIEATGTVESVATIPGEDEDEVWIAVLREVNGGTTRFIERMKPRIWGTEQADCFFVDCGLSYDGDATDTFSGLDHLEGETVAILGDGAVYGTEVVTDGSITIRDEVEKCHVGLPFRYRLQPMRLDVMTPSGTTLGEIKKISKMTISFLDTLNAQYGDGVDTRSIDWRTTEVYDTPPALFTGIKKVIFDGGFDNEDPIIISGEDPLPCSVRAIVPKIEKTEV